MRLVRRDVQPQHVVECRRVPSSAVCRLTCARSIHREQFPPTVLPPARRHTNLTITDCDVMNTWILTSSQNAARAQHGACIFAGSCKYDLGEKTNNEHYILNAATSCADGLKIKRHTKGVATHVVRLRAFRKRHRPAIEYAATTVTYGSAVDRSRSAETQRHRSFLVRWRRRHSATQHCPRGRRN